MRVYAGIVLVAWCAGAAVVPLRAQDQRKPTSAGPTQLSTGARRPLPVPLPAAPAPAAPIPPVPKPAAPKQPAGVEPAKNEPPAAPVPPPPEVERPPVAEAYSYKSEGRRDPFLSLVNRVAFSENRPAQKKPEGVPGLSFDEITLRGIFQGRKGPVALAQGPDGRNYQIRVGDQLFDAVVKAITADSLVVLQEVNDPLSLQKQRERRKTLRVAEEVK